MTLDAVLWDLDAVMWDMDGTLVDTEPVWWRAEIEIITGLGGRWTVEDCKTLIGSDLDAAVEVWMARLPEGAISRTDLAAEVHGEVIRGLKAGVEFQPGALELLGALNGAGIPCALVSASYRSMVDAVLSHCPPDVFTVSVAGDEVTHGKPHPEPYLTAARMLGADPARCIVMEDSPPGATAGNASGALVLAIPQHVPIPPAPRRVEVESLTRLTPDTLQELATSSVDSVRGGLGR
jgi:HAD superfamily hydrolase (TIGR01509 family)